MECTVPNLSLRLAPHAKDSTGFVDCLDVLIRVQSQNQKAGDCLFFLSTQTVTIPFCAFDQDIAVSDDNGPVACETHQESEGYLERLRYIARRDIFGDLVVRYRILPRVQPEDYRSSPYFDLVSEEGGVNGAGLTFLPQFGESVFQFSLQWDLSGMPEGSRGLWCMHEGDFTQIVNAREICYSYYAAGLLRSIEKDNFGFYWFSDPPFPVEEAAGKIQALFLYMADFFQDGGEPYKVFARKNRNASKGGTALMRSYMFGYNAGEAPTAQGLLNLFAHEMVHNWPRLNDEPYGSANWYSEGTAEFYSVVLPQRAGLTTLEEALESLNQKTGNYYANPKQALSNEEAAREFWSDRRAQRIPYGRGLLYIMDTDARIHRKSGGKRCVDDIVLEILGEIQRDGKQGNELWLRLVSRELGADETPVFDRVMSGAPQSPLDKCMKGAFRPVAATFEAEGAEGSLPGYRWELNPDFKGGAL